MEHLVAIPASDSDVVVKLFTGTCSSTASMTVALLDGAGKPLANKVRARLLLGLSRRVGGGAARSPTRSSPAQDFLFIFQTEPVQIQSSQSETPWHCKQKSRAQSGWIERDSFTF